MQDYRFKEVEAGRFYVYERPDDSEHSWKNNRGEGYWEYRREWDENPVKDVVNDFPINIDLELTSRCNLRCKYCKRTSMHTDNSLGVGDMDFDLATRIIDEGAGSIRAVKLNIRGEPLMYPRIAEIVGHCKKRGVREVLMNTNGMLLNKELAVRLLDAGLDSIIFSFDYADKARLEANRLGARFETIVENIRNVADLKRTGGHWGVKIRANSFYDDDVMKEVKALRDIWGDDIDEFTISRVNPTADATRIDLDACEEHFDAVGWQCHQPWQRLGVFTSGDAIFCCTDFEGSMSVGNVKDKGVHALWHSDKIDGLRRLHARKQGYKVPLCRSCHNFIYQVIKYYDEVLKMPYPVKAES